MDKETRNKLRNAIVQCRKLLEQDVLDQLEGTFGIHRQGRMEPESALPHLDDEGLEARRRAVAAVEHIQGCSIKPADAVDQFQREVAFTHLNRLCAFKTLERRGLLEETVSRGPNSNGFKVYLATHPDDERLWRTGSEYRAYKHFLFDVCARLSEEIKVLFDTEHVSSFLFPSQRTLGGVLDLINTESLSDIWDGDEAIGWIYQYFTPKELRDKARKESAAPRNSYELAFRNQFYTPRYVVQFLTDNTLGRLWYEMRKGETRLAAQCTYMVRRPTEIFLAPSEEPPPQPESGDDLPKEELLKQPEYIPHREKKLPWEIRVLDPACGSGHFLLYAFDLLETIYDEAYDDPELGEAVRNRYPDRDAYRVAVPALILRDNLHGIDIDLRSVQIASLVLWIRAQRSYQQMGLKGDGRPRIEKANIVCAEPMPGDEAFLEEFCDSLSPSVLGDLVREVWQKMQLAGEAGSLLKIEEEIRDVVRRAQEAWRKAPKAYKISLFDGTVQRPVEQAEFDFSEVTGPEFWQKAEALLLDAIAQFASRAANGREYGRRLFADDAEQGFAFIELCRWRYDSVLVNPPFGDFTERTKAPLSAAYPTGSQDIYTAFMVRSTGLLADGGLLGSITNRTFLTLGAHSAFRKDFLLCKYELRIVADLGSGVLDTAMVETACSVIAARRGTPESVATFLGIAGAQSKQDALKNAVHSGTARRFSDFMRLPNCSIAYWIPQALIRLYSGGRVLEGTAGLVRAGLQTSDDFRFCRLHWEVLATDIATEKWVPFAKGGEFSPFYDDIHLVVDWEDDGRRIKGFVDSDGRQISYPRNTQWYFNYGLTFPWRTTLGFAPRVLPSGCIFAAQGSAVMPLAQNGEEKRSLLLALGVLSSAPYQMLISVGVGAIEGAAKSYQVGLIQSLPWPEALDTTSEERSTIVSCVAEAVRERRAVDRHDETSRFFVRATQSGIASAWDDCRRANGRRLDTINRTVASLLDIDDPAMDELTSHQYTASLPAYHEQDMPNEGVIEILSYTVGCVLARWDVRVGQDADLAPTEPDLFDSLPLCSPGMLVGADGRPAPPGGIVSEEWMRARPNAITLPPEGSVRRPTIRDDEYPLHIDWDGILVDDQDHQDDIVRRVREVLELLWRDRAPAVEQEACEILGVGDLREYFRNPKHFWDHHVKRYSKSRRKAPIYWFLQSPGRHYALWLYYHRLDRDMLYKALRNYVDPKLNRERNRLKELRDQLAATPEGRERKALEKQIDDQETVVNDVLDFKERLEKVAALGLDPDLNDGVVLSIAPLHELVPWKEPKQYWDDLLAGKYEWSSIGKQLREKGLVRG